MLSIEATNNQKSCPGWACSDGFVLSKAIMWAMGICSLTKIGSFSVKGGAKPQREIPYPWPIGQTLKCHVCKYRIHIILPYSSVISFYSVQYK